MYDTGCNEDHNYRHATTGLRFSHKDGQSGESIEVTKSVSRDTGEIRKLPQLQSSRRETQIALTEVIRLEFLTEPNQETHLDFAGPIKSKYADNVYF